MNPIPKPDWHWPRFEQTLCGSMSDRERLGLPERYLPGRLDAAIGEAQAELRTASIDRLLEALAQRAGGPARRIAAGRLLALAGDPRIRTDAPQMIRIEAAEVQIGLPPQEIERRLGEFDGLGLDRSWIEKECPRHRVALAPYAIARWPVTNFEYRDFLQDSGWPELPSSWAFRRYPAERANHPVYTLSASAADAYAAWLARRTGRGFRLPAEAEWEWAAAGPEGREFPWGETYDADLANTAECGLFDTSPVGAFVGGESPFGLADMGGNVEEYVADPYRAYPGGAFVADHLVQIHGEYRIARGGCFVRFRDLARTRRRHGHNPRSAAYAMGLRLAETL